MPELAMSLLSFVVFGQAITNSGLIQYTAAYKMTQADS